jgi:hypothetical protein
MPNHPTVEVRLVVFVRVNVGEPSLAMGPAPPDGETVARVVSNEVQSNLQSVPYVQSVTIVTTKEEGMTVRFVANTSSNPPGKLADAELHFSDGPLAGMKLIGFAVWERKNGGRNVTFPARQYSVNGERRSFALLRPLVDPGAQDGIRDAILEAFRDHEEQMDKT